MIKEAILKVYKHQDLTYEEAYQTMDEIMSGEASEVQMSAYLTAMSMKGETIDEITASAEAMRAHCVRLLNDKEVLEIVGTGGDESNTFNISTPPQLSYPLQECLLQSTVTVPLQANAVLQMFLRNWG